MLTSLSVGSSGELSGEKVGLLFTPTPTPNLSSSSQHRTKGGALVAVRIFSSEIDGPSTAGGSRRGDQWAIRGRLGQTDHLDHRHDTQLVGHPRIRLILRTSCGRLTSRHNPPRLQGGSRFTAPACRDGGRVGRIFFDKKVEKTEREIRGRAAWHISHIVPWTFSA